MADLPLSCECGQITGVLRDASPATGTHAQCYCSSCRAGEVYAGAPDPAPDPVQIFQTSPYLLDITGGAEHIRAFSFGPRNLLRWQAACCGCALFNTPRNPKMSFVGIRTNRLGATDALGPITGSAFMRLPNGKTKHKGLRNLLVNAVVRIAKNRFSGRWQQNPLFDGNGKAKSEITVISWAARKALLAK